MRPETHLLLNLVAYSLQLGVMIGVAALLAGRLRMTDARISLRYWQTLVVAMFALLVAPLVPALGLAPTGRAGTIDVWFGASTLVEYGTSGWLSVSRAALVVVLVGCVVRLLWIGIGVGALRRIKPGGHYAHHRVRSMSVETQLNHALDDLRVASEAISPEIVAAQGPFCK